MSSETSKNAQVCYRKLKNDQNIGGQSWNRGGGGYNLGGVQGGRGIFFYHIYICIYIYVYVYVYMYISIYIERRERSVCVVCVLRVCLCCV